MGNHLKPCCAAALALALAAGPAAATVLPPIVVNSTADTVANDGFCTLREAITAANTNVASGAAAGECAAGGAPLDTITFNIPGTDSGCSGSPALCTIKPSSSLPSISAPVFVDGYTQPGASANTLVLGDNAKILVELDATNLNPALFLDGTVGGGGASGSTIRGLALTHVLANAAIRATHVNNLTVTGNFIGTDASGTVATSTAQYGIYADNGSATIIGGTAAALRNVIASDTTAIFVEGTGSTNCIVQGNYIGLDKSGTQPLSVTNGLVLRDTTNCLVGGSASGAGNVLGSVTQGISVDTEIVGGGANGTTIQGNLIGTDATGTVRLGQFYGLVIGSGNGTHVGGTGTGDANVISGNAADGIIVVNTPTNLVIEGNRIGTDITGTQPLGNGWCGIDVSGFAGGTNATVGGTVPGAGNVVAFNGTNGVSITSNNVGWTIEGNSIHDNTDMGVVLNGRCDDLTAQPTPNDAGDGDSGPNNLQNYPVLPTVTLTSKTLAQVSGTLDSTNSTFRIEFFANAACDPNGHGEGLRYVGFTDLPSGVGASFGPVPLTVPAHRHVITATATDSAGNTSEFSACCNQDTIFTDGLEGD